MKSGSWLLLLYALPTRRNAERVNLWRKLRKFGAVQLKTSGYVLPDAANHLERFQWLSKQIVDAGGEATLIRVAEIDGVSNREVIALFNHARAGDYKELVAACQDALAGQKGKPSTPKADLARLKQRFAEIRAIDYFDSPAAYDAQMLLQRLENTLGSKKRGAAMQKLQPGDFVGNVWLTRPRPGIDRCGSAWLIRRFVDPKARFTFGMDPAKCQGSLPFDMADVEFSHHGDDCTFETLAKRFGIRDRAVEQIAEMVHDADLEDNKFQRFECIALNRVLDGWAATGISDQELLVKGMDCFEGLYRELKK